MIEYVFLIIGILIILYATIAFVYRVIKGESFWPNLKKMIQLTEVALQEMLLGDS